MNPKKGVFLIYLSLLGALIFGLVSSSLNAKVLSPDELGGYRFIQSVLAVVSISATFGMLSTAGIIFARKNTSLRLHRMMWNGIASQAIIIVLSILISAFIVVFNSAWWANSILFSVLIIILSGSVVLPLLFQETLRAKGDYWGIFFLNITPQASYFLFVVSFYLLQIKIDGLTCLFFFLCGQLISGGYLLHRAHVKPIPSILAFCLLWRRNINSGLNIYWATILGALTAQSGILLLQFFATSAHVAEFSLALVITAPLTMLPSAVGTAYFSKITKSDGFPISVLLFTWSAVFIFMLMFYFASPFVVLFLYGNKYENVTELAIWCAAASLLQGMGDIYNRYFLISGKSVILLKVAIVVFVISISLNFIFAHNFQSFASAWAKFIGSASYVLILMVLYKFRFLFLDR